MAISDPGRFVYVVTADFESSELCEEWIAWLRDGHLADVLAGGALEASVVRLAPTDAAPRRCEARYRFADAEAFAAYERGAAVQLRAEGLARFPASRGVRMSRSTGEILATRSR